MRIGVLGAGISGLSIGRLLSDRFEIELLERDEVYGGIAKTRKVEGATYHPIGGHCFNSKYPEVLDFVFNTILSKDKWHQVVRNAVIKLKEQEVSYPIEYAISEIFNFSPELAINITRDFLSTQDDQVYSNLEDWFRKKFGNTLAELYFIPYNTKFWNRPPSEMSPVWVEGKLPIPDKLSFFKGLVNHESDIMPHSKFFYPNTNDQNTFIDQLARGLNITSNYQVNTIRKTEDGKWLINEDKQYDLIISTLPLNIVPILIKETPSDILEAAAKLKYNKVTTMFWETDGTDRTWTYVPDSESFFHRFIHIGSFFAPKQNYTITEVVGEKSREEMIENGKRDPFLKRPLDYNISDHAYVVFDENYEPCTKQVKAYLQSIGLYTLGRFGEWQYYNMDICIKSSMELKEQILAKFDPAGL